MKAPRTWPKSWDSNNAAGMAAQLIATQGPRLRELLALLSRASGAGAAAVAEVAARTWAALAVAAATGQAEEATKAPPARKTRGCSARDVELHYCQVIACGETAIDEKVEQLQRQRSTGEVARIRLRELERALFVADQNPEPCANMAF